MSNEIEIPARGCLRVVVRGVLRAALRVTCAAILLLGGIFFGLFAPQIYHHFVLFPKQAQAWKDLASKRSPVALQTGWQEYRGVMHSHSYISHDSESSFEHISEALRKAQCQFIFITDHFVDGKADYSLGWHGMHDGLLFVQGYEMQAGFMPWGLAPGTVFSSQEKPQELAKKIHELGGVLCIAHCEEPRPWDIPEIDGMEIYNIHSDLLLNQLTEPDLKIELIKEILMNIWTYPEQSFRCAFHEKTLTMLEQKWDLMSLHRKLTGIAGNDCHENTGLRGVYTVKGTLLLLDTGHNDPEHKVAEFKLNPVTRLLVKMCFGKLEPGRQLFRFELDPYERSARFVNTHLLAKELTEPALLDAIRAGRAFVAFNMIADAGGFAYVAEGNGQRVTMGDQIPLSPGLKLRAEAPLPCRFELVRDGVPVTSQSGKTFEFDVKEPGKYRIEADLDIVHTQTPWIRANPIEVTPAAL